MDPCRVLPRCQLVKKLLILVRDPFPIVDSTNPFRGTAPKVLCDLRLGFYQLNFFRQVARIQEEQPVSTQNLNIKRICMGQDAVSISQSLYESRIGSAHHVTMEISIRIAMEFLYVLNVVHVPQKAYPVPGISFQIINELTAIICVTGNRQQPFGWRVLEALHNQRGIIFGHQTRSEEHTSELQSPDHLVCRLLLEKKKQ